MGTGAAGAAWIQFLVGRHVGMVLAVNNASNERWSDCRCGQKIKPAELAEGLNRGMREESTPAGV